MTLPFHAYIVDIAKYVEIFTHGKMQAGCIISFGGYSILVKMVKKWFVVENVYYYEFENILVYNQSLCWGRVTNLMRKSGANMEGRHCSS